MGLRGRGGASVPPGQIFAVGSLALEKMIAGYPRSSFSNFVQFPSTFLSLALPISSGGSDIYPLGL